MEDTNYYYKLENSQLNESLQRFASLLFTPLLRADAVRREYNAIQSEFVKDKLEAPRRLWRLIRHLAEVDHPLHRLGAGSLESLNHDDTISELKKFHAKLYQPRNMNCVIYGNYTLGYLTSIANEHFSRFHINENYELNLPKTLYGTETLGSFIEYQLLREGFHLNVIWSVQNEYCCGVIDVLNMLSIRHYKSLTYVLRNKGWASAVMWSVLATLSEATLVKVHVDITELGLQNVNEILEGVYYEIKSIIQLPISAVENHLASFYQQKLQHLSNQEVGKEHHYVKMLSVKMRLESNSEHLFGPPYITSYKCFNKTISHLTPDTSLTLLGKFSADSDLESLEPWYEIPYKTRALSESQLQAFRHPKNVLDVFSLPQLSSKVTKHHVNTFLLPNSDQATKPTLIMKDSGLAVWWMQDHIFHLIRTDIILLVYRTNENTTPLDVANHLVLVEMLKDQLSEIPLFGSLSIKYQSSCGIVIYFHSEAKPELVGHAIESICSALVSLDLTLKDKFQWIVRRQAYLDVVKSRYAEAYKHVLYKSRVLLELNVHSIEDILSALDGISLKLFTNFYRRFILDFGVKALVYGNVLKSSATGYARKLYKLVNRSLTRPNNIPFHPTLKYPKGKYRITAKYPNDREKASVADLLILLGPSPWNSDEVESSDPLFTRCVFAQLIATILHEPMFVQLRTREQLGYSVFVKYLPHFGLDYIHIAIQGSGHGASKLANSITNFLNNFRSTLVEMVSNDSNWKESKTTMIKKISALPSTQKEMVIEMSSELFSPEAISDRRELLISALENLSSNKMMEYYDKFIIGNDSRHMLLTSQSENVGNDEAFTEQYKSIDIVDKTLYTDKFLYWHLTYLGIDMGK